MEQVQTILTLIVESGNVDVPFYTQLPFLLFTIQAVNRYIKFYTIGTFNVKFQYHWFTKVKIMISITLSVLTLLRVFQLRSNFRITPFLLLSHQFLTWVCYTPMLSFDQKRALYHDWNFLKSFHFLHIITLTIQLMNYLLQKPIFIPDILQLVEYLFSLTLFFLVFQYKRDYFFPTKGINRQLTTPLLTSPK